MNQKPNRLGVNFDSEEASFSAKSLLSSLGGWLGVTESVVPTLIYVLIFTFTKNVLWAAIPAGASSLFFILRQFVVRKSLASAVAGGVSVLIAVLLPLRQGGQASDYFTIGLLTNLGYFLAMLISIAVRWPIVGILVSGVTSSGFGWRKQKSKLRRFDAATLLWVLLFGLRLTVEFPLYLANQLQALGLVKLVMGVPFYAIVVWLTWLVIRPTFQRRS